MPPFGTGLISSILIFPQALISGTGSIVSVCCIPFRSVWLHLSAPAAQSYQVYLDTKPFISPRADKWYFVAQLAAALASWLSGYTWPNNSMLIGRGRDLGYNRATMWRCYTPKLPPQMGEMKKADLRGNKLPFLILFEIGEEGTPRQIFSNIRHNFSANELASATVQSFEHKKWNPLYSNSYQKLLEIEYM